MHNAKLPECVLQGVISKPLLQEQSNNSKINCKTLMNGLFEK